MAIGGVRCPDRVQRISRLAGLVTAVSTILLFSGSPALGSSLASAGSAIYVPAAAHAPGQNGANWRTDVEIHNPGSDTASFTVALLMQNADNSSPQTSTFTLGSRQSTRYSDILSSAFGVTGAAALRFTVTAGTIIVTSRTYNLMGENPWTLPVGASFGQFVPGIPESDAIGYGQEGRLIQLTQQAASTLDGFRTNVGIVNTTGIPIDIRIDLYRSDGTLLGTKSGSDTNLPPYGFRQLTQIFSAWGNVADGYAIVKTTTSSGRLIAFASVIDNHNSGDPIFVPAVTLSGAGPTTLQVYLPASAHAAGQNGANWRTDVEVHNPGTTTATITIELLMQNTDNGGSAPTRSATLGAQQSIRYVDILSTLFGTTGAAALRFTTQAGAILVNSRTYNLIGPNSAGLPVGASFGQFVPAVSADDAIAEGDEGRLVQLTQRDASSLADFRTNVGIVNATGQTIDVQIDLYNADGTLLGSVSGGDTQLLPYEFRQINAILGRFTSWCADGYAVVQTTTPGGSLFAFGSVVDNHLTGDPIFIPAVRIVPTGPLALFAPSLAGPLLSGVPATLVVGARKASDAPLTFTLVSGPAGAAIGASSGVITWTPPVSAEGTTVGMHVSATDGTTAADVTFSIPVASSTPATTTLSGSTLTVTQSGTLQGLSVTFPSQLSPAPGQVHVSSVPADQVPPIPDGVTRVSDFFRLTPVEAQGDDPITLSIPAKLVPSGVSPFDMKLFVYTDQITDSDGPAWVPTEYQLDVLPGGSVTINVFGLGELSFIGYWSSAAGLTVAAESASALPTRLDFGEHSVSISCSPRVSTWGTTDPHGQVCDVTGDTSMTVTVRHFDPNPWVPAATVTELIGWIAAGRLKFSSYGMNSLPVFKVVVEPMPHPTWLGFVTTEHNERRRVLHLSSAANKKDAMQGTAVHEYFHHAQGETRIAGHSNAIADMGTETKWLYEGTARWFEDEVYDTLDTYKLKEANPLYPILLVGLNAFDTSANPAPPHDPKTRSYSRFGFFKMISNHCSDFSLPGAFNVVDPVADPTAVATLATGLASPSWNCNFGLGFGSSNSASLASALLYYLYATQLQNDISLLDPNETEYFFAAPTDALVSADDTAGPPPAAASFGPYWFRPASGGVMLIRSISGLDPSKAAVLEADIARPPVWVWVGDYAQHKTLDAGEWWNTTGTWRYVYGQNGQAPLLFVAMVNPSTTERASVTLRARIRPSVSCGGTYRDELNFVIGDLTQGSYPIWTAASKGMVTSPQSLTVKTTWNGASSSTGTCTENVSGHGGTPPYAITVSGSLQAAPDQMSGSAKNTFGVTLAWTYSNPRLQVDYPSGPISPGPGFSYTFTVPTSNFRKELKVCVLYDEVGTLTDKNGLLLETDTKLSDTKACVYYEFAVNNP